MSEWWRLPSPYWRIILRPDWTPENDNACTTKEKTVKTLEIQLTDEQYARLESFATEEHTPAHWVEQFLRYSPGSPTQPRVPRVNSLKDEG